MPNRSYPPPLWLAMLFGCGWTLLTLAGCQGSASPTPVDFSQEELPGDDELRDKIDEVLDFTLRDRRLSSQRNAAWQILHGVLAYGRHFPIEHEGRTVETVDWVLGGGRLTGWDVRKGDVGLKARLGAGTGEGQGHEDQWLAVLAQCDLPSDQPIIVGDQTFTMRDLMQQAMWDVYVDKECSWTLIALSLYIPPEQTWTAKDGNEWSSEKVIGMEARQDINMSACGGSHRLIGMQMALANYQKKNPDVELTDGWKAAQQKIDEAITKARLHQQPSGAFSVNYFQRPADSPDLAVHLGSTGHTLEFLSLALPQERLSEPWVVKGVAELCELFQKTRNIDLECGALYHAAHGLVLYRQRRFGKREYVLPQTTEAKVAQGESDTPVKSGP